MKLHESLAKKIPFSIRKEIIEENLIETAVNLTSNQAMLRIFDIYEEFIDSGSLDNWSCFKCREQVLSDMRQLRPYIESLNKKSILDAL